MRENLGPWVSEQDEEEYDKLQKGQKPGFGVVAPEGMTGTGDDSSVLAHQPSRKDPIDQFRT